MAYEITERFDGITVWRDSTSGRYDATRDSDGVAVEPIRATHINPSLAVQILLEDEAEAVED